MIQQSRHQGNATAVSRLESILQLTQLWRAQTKAGRDAAGTAAASSECDRGEELASLLSSLGLPAGTTAAARFGHNSAATTRAVVVIGDWMSYLPRDCVRAMVADGWHWSS
jgi:hypothetical protein